MLQEFRSFIARGNVLDLAVAVIIGAAFGKIVSSLTDDLIMPLVGYLFGGLDFSSFGFSPGAGFGIGSYTLFSASAVTGSLGSTLSGDVGGLLGTLSVEGSNLVLTTAVPEPGTFALCLVAAAAAGLGRRCRRRSPARS